METMLPTPDIIPVPGPVWLFNFLLTLTFTGHVLFMNCLLGGTLLGALSILKGRPDNHHSHLAGVLFRNLPVATSFTITLGVAPLLFAQVLYGQFLYSSSILLGWWWLAVIPLAITAYYSIYTLRFQWDKPGLSKRLLSVSALSALCVIAFIYVNNMTLMLRHESWAQHYFPNMATGALNWSDVQVYPRFLHMFLGAVAIAGLWIMVLSSMRKTEEWAEWAFSYGAKVFIYTTLINIGIGILFLMSLPKEIMMIYMGRNMIDSVLLVVSLFVAAGALFWIFRAGKTGGKFSFYNGLAHTAALLVIMIIMRDRLRIAFLEPVFTADQLVAEPQWSIFGVFAFTLIAGIAALIWMVVTAAKGNNKE